MLARLQRFTTIGAILLALAWAVAFGMRGHPLWAAAGALIIVFGYAFVLALEFCMLHHVGRNEPHRASVPVLLRAWLGEVLYAPRVFCWRQPFRANVEPDHLPTGEPAQRVGIVFIHGFVCNRALWNPWLARLRAAGVPFVAVSLEPVFGSIDDYSAIIDEAVTRVRMATGYAPLIVAHSMGGLAARVWLQVHGADERVQGVITIGTPHRGTWLARFAFSANGRQMRLGGSWIRALAQREPAARYQLFTCFYGHCDNIAFPPSTGTLPGADNRHVPGTAHVHMSAHDQVFNEVWRRVAQHAPCAA